MVVKLVIRSMFEAVNNLCLTFLGLSVWTLLVILLVLLLALFVVALVLRKKGVVGWQLDDERNVEEWHL